MEGVERGVEGREGEGREGEGETEMGDLRSGTWWWVVGVEGLCVVSLMSMVLVGASDSSWTWSRRARVP